MTETEYLAEISAKMDQILAKWTWLETFLQRGKIWITTPAGEFALVGRVTYGEMLLALIFCVFIGSWVMREVQKLLSPGGWW